MEERLNVGVLPTDVKQMRLDGCLNDEAVMGRLREMPAADWELYAFALENYEKQWDSRIESCC